MKLVQLKNKRIEQLRGRPKQPEKKKLPSALQRRQRELSWCLYVTEGYTANLHHLLAVNAVTMSRDDLRVVHMAIRQAENISRALRVSMTNTDDVSATERRDLVQQIMQQGVKTPPNMRMAVN